MSTSSYRHYEDVNVLLADPPEVKEQKYLEAIEKHPEGKGQFLVQLCWVYQREMRNPKKLLACCQRILNECTETQHLADAYWHLAMHYEDKGDYARAIASMQKRFDLDNTDWEALRWIATYYFDMGEFDKAEKAIAPLLTMKDEDGTSLEDEYYRQMAEFYTHEGDYDKALECKQKLSKSGEEETISESAGHKHFEMGKFFTKANRKDEARQHYLKAIEIYEQLLANTGHGIEKIEQGNGATYKNHDEARIRHLENLASLYGAVGDTVRSAEYLNKTIEAAEYLINNPEVQSPNKTWYQTYLPDLVKRAGKPRQAIEMYQKQLEAPQRAQALNYYYRNIAYIYAEENDLSRACEWWQKLLDIEPESEEALRNLGFLYYEQSKLDIAKPYLERYIELYPLKEARAYSALAMCFDQREDSETVLSYLRQALKVNNDRDRDLTCAVYLVMGKTYWNPQKDAENAMSCFRKMMEHDPTPEQRSSADTCILAISFSPEGHHLVMQFWNDFPAEKNSGFHGSILTPPQIEALPYHHSKIPKDSTEKYAFGRKLEKEFYYDLKNNPAYQEYFARHTPYTVEKFIYKYAEYKSTLVTSFCGYLPGREERADFILRFYVNNMFDLILQKKLFNLQVLWRAEKVTIPQIEICEDFREWSSPAWGTYIDCPFLEEVTPREIEVMKQFLMDDNFNEHTKWWLHSWQDYQEFMEVNADGDREYMPEWYEFYDGRMGTGALLLLPDERGKKEAYYKNIYYDWKRKQPADPPPPPSNEPPYIPDLPAYEGEYTKFMNTFENNYLNLLHQHHAEDMKSPDQYYPADELNDAIIYLRGEKNPPYIKGGLVWYEAVIKCYRKAKNKAMAEMLDEVYAEYLMKRQLDSLNIESAASEPQQSNRNYGNRQREAECILKGRELLGEPRDFNF